MIAWVNQYVDELGRDSGKLLSLTPNLHIVLAGEGSNREPFHSVGLRCPKCGETIEGRNIFPLPEDTRVLGCDCLTVLFGAKAFPADWIVAHWSGLHRIKADAENQLAARGN